MRKAALAALALVALAALATVFLWASDTGRNLARAAKFRAYVAGLDGVSRTRDIAIRMPDGVSLATDLYLPEGLNGQVPTILIRLPYGKTRYWEARHWISLFALASYAVVVQDMRGRYGSEGVFAPWPYAAGDGAATLDWIAAQDWSDGYVASVGCSALGESQIVLAAQGHPALRAIIPIGAGGAIGSAGGLHQYFGTFEGGIPLLAASFGWFANHGGKTSGFMRSPAEIDFPPALSSLPVHGMVSRIRPDPTDFEWLLDNFDNPTAMSDAGYISDTETLGTPALLIDGWYDPNVNATLELARQMQRDGVLRHTVIGPGQHCDFGRVFVDGSVGDIAVDTGQSNDMNALALAFANHLLRDGPAPDLARYLVYVMQEDRWLSAGQWPPDGAREEVLFLSGDRLSNTTDSGQRHIRSDPMDPVPSVGGAICCTGNPDLRTGPLDQRPIESRADILIFDGPPLEQPLRLAGPISARLWLSADVPDTDLVVRLTDVAPDEASITIREGALRLRYRTGIADPQLLTPGKIYAVDVSLRDIAYLVRPGHHLRLHVAGSSFPRLARNMNGGKDPNRETEPIVATISVHSGPTTPSSVRFFVLPETVVD